MIWKNAEDVMEMCAILFGEEFMETHPVTTGNCNGNSPLIWDETMLNAYEEPKLIEDVNDELLDYITRRERDIPAVGALNNQH